MILTNARWSGKSENRRQSTKGGEPQATCLRVATNRSIRYHRPMVRVRIRLARSGDCRALAEMRFRFRAETESVTETKSQFVRRCTSWMRKRFRAGSGAWRCWVLEDGKRLLGHVCVQLFEKIPNPVNDEPELHAYVTNLYVVPEMRGQGLGKRLLNKALSWCHARGTDAVILWSSPASKSFYRRCGFVAPGDILELRHGAQELRLL
jgi:GNAT superfamily N-acetyltransferase